ncbi:hypothetical protein [Streptomyces alanosinicus]|uniref:hypothetical protein n=1 Tax=Streptomyces alanosinicus TaxID=68171 RepID=UPI00167B42E0|nr:hypothetical protein [Streptomyces alanosinicus]
MDDDAEAVSPAYVQAGDLPCVERFRQCAQWCRLAHGLMGPMGIVMLLEFAQCPTRQSPNGRSQIAFADNGQLMEFRIGMGPSPVWPSLACRAGVRCR